MSELQTYEATKLASFINKISFRVVGSATIPDGSSTASDWPPYVIGAGSICLAIFIAFVVWGFILSVAKCCTSRPPCYGMKGLRNINDVWRVTKRLQLIRVLFFLSTMVAIASVVLFAYQGSFGFLDAEDNYVTFSVNLQDLLTSMSRTLNDLVKSTNTVVSNTNDVLAQMNDCASAISTVTGVEFLTPTDIDDAIDFVDSANTDVIDVGTFDETMASFSGELSNAQVQVTKYGTWYGWVSFGVALFVGILVLPFVYACMLAAMGSVKPGFLRFVSSPLLWMLNIWAFIFALLNLVYGIVAVVGSDFCVDDGGPDNTLLDFLTTNSPEIKDYYSYYFFCNEQSYFEGDFSAAQNALTSATTSLTDLKNDYSTQYTALKDAVVLDQAQEDFLDAQCLPVMTMAGSVADSTIPTVSAAVTSLGELLDCNTLTPIYQGLVYNTTCKGFADSFVWMWITSTTLVFGVLLMNSFRRAIYDDVVVVAGDDLDMKEHGGYDTGSETDSEEYDRKRRKKKGYSQGPPIRA